MLKKIQEKLETAVSHFKYFQIVRAMDDSDILKIKKMIQNGKFDTGDLCSIIEMAIEREDEDMVEMLMHYKPRKLNALSSAIKQDNPVVLEIVFHASSFEHCKQALAYSSTCENGSFEQLLEWLDMEDGYLIALQECINQGENEKAKKLLTQASKPINVCISTTMAADENNEELVELLINQPGFNKEETLEYLEDMGEMQNKEALLCLNKVMAHSEKKELDNITTPIPLSNAPPPNRL